LTASISTVLYPLPGTVRGYTVLKDGFYTVVINENLSEAARLRAYWHEVKHIECGDYDKKCSAELIEIHAHESN